MLQAELGNYELIQNEINSIKRAIRNEKQVFTTEKIVFRFTLAYPLPVYEKTRMQLWSQFKKAFAAIENDTTNMNKTYCKHSIFFLLLKASLPVYRLKKF